MDSETPSRQVCQSLTCPITHRGREHVPNVNEPSLWQRHVPVQGVNEPSLDSIRWIGGVLTQVIQDTSRPCDQGETAWDESNIWSLSSEILEPMSCTRSASD